MAYLAYQKPRQRKCGNGTGLRPAHRMAYQRPRQRKCGNGTGLRRRPPGPRQRCRHCRASASMNARVRGIRARPPTGGIGAATIAYTRSSMWGPKKAFRESYRKALALPMRLAELRSQTHNRGAKAARNPKCKRFRERSKRAQPSS